MPEKKKDAGQAEMQAAADQATEQGYVGIAVDPTPNEAYTLAGVTAGQPTPETDEGARKEAAAHAAEVAARFANPTASEG